MVRTRTWGGPVSDKLPAVLAEVFAGVPEALVSRYLASRGEFLKPCRAGRPFLLGSGCPPGRCRMPGQQPEAGGLGEEKRVQETLFGPDRRGDGLFPRQPVPEVPPAGRSESGTSIKAGDLIARFAETCGIALS